MKCKAMLSTAACLALLLAQGAPTWGQNSIFHDPFLNWDFINFTGQAADDFEIVVETPEWKPGKVYKGFFPEFTTFEHEETGGTVLSWSGRNVAENEVAHVGAAMMGSGRILDAYWTSGGDKIGPSIAIVYERTEVFPDPNNQEDVIAMNLQVAPGYEGVAALRNIRTFMDLPEDLLGLDDLTRQLPLDELQDYETQPFQLVREDPSGRYTLRDLGNESQLPADSFFDVFVGLTVNAGPEFESLLTADVVRVIPGGDSQVIGRFWNLNPQSPEPSSLVLLLIGCAASVFVPRTRRMAV